jgi:hypothetical protein
VGSAPGQGVPVRPGRSNRMVASGAAAATTSSHW